MTHHIAEFPFVEIRDDVLEGGNGDYFRSWQHTKDAGFDDDQIWSVVHGDETDVYIYGPPHHYVNLVGFIATQERHDGNTYYEEPEDG